MSEMTELQQAVTVGTAVFATIITRFLPYILFPAGKERPAFVRYLGSYLAPWQSAVSSMYRSVESEPQLLAEYRIMRIK